MLMMMAVELKVSVNRDPYMGHHEKVSVCTAHPVTQHTQHCDGISQTQLRPWTLCVRLWRVRPEQGTQHCRWLPNTTIDLGSVGDHLLGSTDTVKQRLTSVTVGHLPTPCFANTER